MRHNRATAKELLPPVPASNRLPRAESRKVVETVVDAQRTTGHDICMRTLLLSIVLALCFSAAGASEAHALMAVTKPEDCQAAVLSYAQEHKTTITTSLMECVAAPCPTLVRFKSDPVNNERSLRLHLDRQSVSAACLKKFP
jgi:hypothetical protein